MQARHIWVFGLLVGMTAAQVVAQECVGQPNGTPCTSDGIECTDDVCLGQTCTHLQSMDGTPCADDGSDCTIDVCVSGVCTHNPRPAGFPCGDPSNTGCTNPDLCDDSGNCQSANAPDGLPCDDGQYCTAHDACFDGVCIGGGPQCPPGEVCDEGGDVCIACTTNADCNDYNPCTADVCTANQCAYDPVTGAPCGSSVDAECTNPDACDMFGVCRSNDEPDGTPCTGGVGTNQCTSGVCEPPSFTSFAAPEDVYVGSTLTGYFEPTVPYPGGGFTGQVIDNSGVRHAAYWEPGPSGPRLRVLDTSGVDSTLNRLACDRDIDYFCLGVGEKGGLPVAWAVWKGGDPTAPLVEDPGMPLGAVGAILVDGPLKLGGPAPGGGGDTPYFIATGILYDERDLLHGVVWTRDAAGTWTSMRLPQLGPNTQSRAMAVTWHADYGVWAIGGAAETPLGHMVPAIWHEMTPGMLDFDDPILLPLLPSIVSGEVVALGGQQGEEVAAGTVVTAAGNRVGAVWACGAGYTGCSMLVLPPLPELTNAKVVGIDDGNIKWPLMVVGTSYDTGELADGRATLWWVSRSPLALVGVSDLLNLAFPDSPVQDRLIASTPNLATCLVGGGSCDLAGVLIQDPGQGTIAAGPTPHVILLSDQPPANIPTVSEWGLAVLALLVLMTGTHAILQARRKAEGHYARGVPSARGDTTASENA